MASADLKQELNCSICMNIYEDPVTLRCGHNFCWICIDGVLDTQDGDGLYCCPECRVTFRKWPPLQRNITLCNVVENFLSTQLRQEEITGIRCTYCIHDPVTAVKSCLLCEASLCDKHLKAHSKGPEHVLTDLSTSLEKKKCFVHKKILEYYCIEDAACICVSCSLVGEHRGHWVETLDEASEKKKKQLRNILQKLTTQKKETEKKVWGLEKRKRKAQAKTQGEAKKVTALCTEIRRWVDNLEKELLSEISMREEQVSLSLSNVIENLEMKKDELSKKIRHIEELCNMTDPLVVLQEPGTCSLCDPEKVVGDEDTGVHDGDDEDKGGHAGGARGVQMISHILNTLSGMIRDVNVTFYGKDPVDILLDVNTVANNLIISNDLKTATWTWNIQNRPETAERFQYDQVMSSRSFTSGRHYWDVEISRSVDWRVGMCYPSIDRSEDQSYIGNNKKSWGLCKGLVYKNQCLVIHDSKVIRLPHQISSDRVRIYVDYEAGQLSFYELCDPIRHLHTFTATFTEPLHAALWIWEGSIKISERIKTEVTSQEVESMIGRIFSQLEEPHEGSGYI